MEVGGLNYYFLFLKFTDIDLEPFSSNIPIKFSGLLYVGGLNIGPLQMSVKCVKFRVVNIPSEVRLVNLHMDREM